MNAAIVVTVEIIIGNAISPTPFFAASILDRPSFCISLNAFSTTTIPLSTNIPRPIISPNRVILFIVYPKKFKIINDMNIDIGIAKPTNKAFLNPKKNIKTVITKITPKIILLVRSLTRLIVSLD